MTMTAVWAVACALASADAAIDEEPAAAPAAAATRATLVLELGGDLEEGQRARLSNLVASRLGRFGGLVVTRQREARLDEAARTALAACALDDATCLGAAAASLGKAVIVAGTAARVSGQLAVSLIAVSREGVEIGTAKGSLSGSPDEAAAGVAALVDDLGRAITGEEPADAVGPTHVAPAASDDGLDLQQLAVTGGGAALATGAVVFLVAAIPGLLTGAAESDLTTLRVRYVDSGGDRAILDEASLKQADVDAYRGVHNSIGVASLWTGGLLAVVGGGLLAAGVTVLADGDNAEAK